MSSEPQIFFSDVNERQGSFLRRTFLVGGGALLGLTGLSARLGQLQLLDARRYSTAAVANQFNDRLQPPPRGRITDRYGVTIAGNRPSFTVSVVRDSTPDLDATLDLLARLLPDTADRRRQIIRDVNASPRFVAVPVKSDLSWEEFARVNLFAPELPGVVADMTEARFYPFGGAFAHAVGYVAKVTAEDIDELEERGERPSPLMYHPGFRIGRRGVERTLDANLRGRPGFQRVEVDARGRVRGEDVEGSRPATPGDEVVLTLDADVQNRALEVFGEESGAAVVMNCQTGDVLCMASAPSFDANLFVGGVPSRIYRAWADYERRPLLDKAVYGLFPPGSTFKMTTALACLEAGVSATERVHCSGAMRYGNRTFHCHKRGGHGPQNMHDAIKNSCNIYFYTMGVRAGIERIARAAESLGFGRVYEMGISGQRAGIVPSPEWVRQARPRDPVWHPGETLSVAIGQGALEVNALQLAVMTARLANGRKALEPRLIHSVGGAERPSGAAVPDLPFPDEHLDIVRAGMAAVANDVTGTAYRRSQLGLGDILMAGKTGTAQARGGRRDNRSVEWGLKDHGLYVAFAPHDAPKYAIAVIVQHGGGSGPAASLAREIMRTTLLKDPEMRARIERPLPPAPQGPVEEETLAPPPTPIEPVARAAVASAPPSAEAVAPASVEVATPPPEAPQ